LRFDALVVAQATNHFHPLCWFDGFHAVDTCRPFALIVLRHLAYRKGTGGLGFHQEPLKVVNSFVIPTIRGSINPFLQSVHLPRQFAPGDRCPVFDWL
jgi:hypothetical protein